MFEDLYKTIEQQTIRIINKKSEDMLNEIKSSINIPYPPPSQPGEPPHKRTGDLQSSFRINKRDSGTEIVREIITDEMKLANWLEYGTERMEPRPFILPINNRLEEDLPRIANNIIKGI